MSTPDTSTERALPTGTWRLDPDETTITIAATKLGFLNVPATLTLLSGTIEIDANHQVTSVDVVADAASYTSKSSKRNDHVRSDDFLDAAAYPEVAFRASTVSKTAGGYRAEGSVTVKGRVSPLDVVIGDLDFDTARGSFTATATIDRNVIGVDKLPSVVIGSKLQLTVTAAAFTAQN